MNLPTLLVPSSIVPFVKRIKCSGLELGNVRANTESKLKIENESDFLLTPSITYTELTISLEHLIKWISELQGILKLTIKVLNASFCYNANDAFYALLSQENVSFWDGLTYLCLTDISDNVAINAALYFITSIQKKNSSLSIEIDNTNTNHDYSDFVMEMDNAVLLFKHKEEIIRLSIQDVKLDLFIDGLIETTQDGYLILIIYTNLISWKV